MTVYVAENNGPLDWDGWRENYDAMTFADQREFYKTVAAHFPDQSHHNAEVAHTFFDEIGPCTVAELGGWDGALAGEMLARHPIELWTNYDLVVVPQVCASPRYRLQALTRPLWDAPVEADAFVAMHVIEHVKAIELARLVAQLRVRECLIESPLEDGPTDWSGYSGTHVLELGWDGVDGLFERAGFEITHEWVWGRFYAR